MSLRREFVHEGDLLRVRAEDRGDGAFVVHVGSRVHEVRAVVLPDGRLRCEIDGHAFEADQATCGDGLQVRLRGHTWSLQPAKGVGRAAAAADGTITAPMTGTVLQVLVREGDEVREGQPLLVLTAMKMEHRLTAPFEGTVVELAAQDGATVDQGAVLARVAKLDSE